MHYTSPLESDWFKVSSHPTPFVPKSPTDKREHQCAQHFEMFGACSAASNPEILKSLRFGSDSVVWGPQPDMIDHWAESSSQSASTFLLEPAIWCCPPQTVKYPHVLGLVLFFCLQTCRITNNKHHQVKMIICSHTCSSLGTESASRPCPLVPYTMLRSMAKSSGWCS